MKKVLWALTIIVYSASCQEDDFLIEDNLEKPLIERTYYTRDPSIEQSRLEHTYLEDKLIATQAYWKNEPTGHTSYEYNSRGDVVKKRMVYGYRYYIDNYEYNSARQVTKLRTRVYITDSNGLDHLKEENETVYDFEDGVLIRVSESGGSYKVYKYTGNKCIEITSYNKENEQIKRTIEKYKNGLLFEIESHSEKSESPSSYTTTNSYDGQKRLETVSIDGALCKQYIYKDNQLLRKNEWSDSLYNITRFSFDRYSIYEY